MNKSIIEKKIVGNTGCPAFSKRGAITMQSNNPIFKSIIKCPECGIEKEETMPTDSCQFFYKCTNCKAMLKPNKGDCCVFCSFGSIKCPSKQNNTGI